MRLVSFQSPFSRRHQIRQDETAWRRPDQEADWVCQRVRVILLAAVPGFQLETNSSLSDYTWIEFVTRHSPFHTLGVFSRIKMVFDVCPSIVEYERVHGMTKPLSPPLSQQSLSTVYQSNTHKSFCKGTTLYIFRMALKSCTKRRRLQH